MAEPYATSADLKARYRVQYVDEEDEPRVDMLLGAASRLIRHKAPGIDERSDIDRDLITDVVCEMVWLAISSPTPGVTQETRSVGSVSISATFEGAAGRIRLTKAQLDLFRPARVRSRASSVSNAPAAASTPSSQGVYVDGVYVGAWTGPSPNPIVYTG